MNTSPSGWNSGGCCTPFIAEISGRTSLSKPLSSRRKNARRAGPSVSMRVNSSRTRWRDRVFEACGKAHCSQHAQLVFAEALLRLSDGADDPSFQVLASGHKIQHFAARGIEQHAVDGEIPARYILLRVAAETNFVGMTAVRVSNIAAEGRHFNRA